MRVKNIEIFYEDILPIKLLKKTLNKYVSHLINREIKKIGSISIILCSDDYLLTINKQYLQHNYYTDIITFDYVEENRISGDLFISIDRVKENAEKYNVEVKQELFRVIFHGILHLVGYNDKTEEEQAVMRKKENLYLSGVDFEEIEI
jgi:rRNA maturation RNase YbeY